MKNVIANLNKYLQLMNFQPCKSPFIFSWKRGFSSYVDEQDMEKFGNSYPVIAVELLCGNKIKATQRRLNIDPPIIPHFILQ